MCNNSSTQILRFNWLLPLPTNTVMASKINLTSGCPVSVQVYQWQKLTLPYRAALFTSEHLQWLESLNLPLRFSPTGYRSVPWSKLSFLFLKQNTFSFFNIFFCENTSSLHFPCHCLRSFLEFDENLWNNNAFYSASLKNYTIIYVLILFVKYISSKKFI